MHIVCIPCLRSKLAYFKVLASGHLAKTISEVFFSETYSPIDFKLGMQLPYSKVYFVYRNYIDPDADPDLVRL